MKLVVTYVMVIVWFFHLLVGAGGVFAIIRLWPERQIDFIKFTMIHLHAVVLDALMAIFLLFMARNVQLTWKFSIAWFIFTLARDIVRLPLILWLFLGSKIHQ